MKTLRNALIAGALIFSATTFAQYNTGLNNGRMGGGGMGIPQAGSGSSGKKKGEKLDYVDETVKYYTKELTLDDFQAAAVRETIKSHMDQLTSLAQDTEMTMDEKKDHARDINDKIDSEISRMLSAEQKEKFKKLQEKRPKN